MAFLCRELGEVRDVTNPGDFCRLSFGSINKGEKDSREQPEERLWIHGRAPMPIYWQWVCHSPNVMKTDIFR
jgi:hypothetical protein